jgi:hypothetical protein
MEYAYIVWHTAQYERDSWINLIHLHPGGHKFELVEKKSFMQKAPDWSDQFRAWVTQLGEEGYEMAGMMNTGGGTVVHSTFHYWFKRPLL